LPSKQYQTKEMKTACGQLMTLQQHLYNGFARPSDYSILHRNGLLGAHVGTGMDLSARAACWPTAIVADVAGYSFFSVRRCVEANEDRPIGLAYYQRQQDSPGSVL